MIHRLSFILAAALVIGHTAGFAAGPEGLPVTLTLREPLDRDWEAQWVSWPVALAKGALSPERARFTTHDGQPIEGCVAVGERYDDGTVETGTVYAYAGLRAGQTRTLTLSRGDRTFASGIIGIQDEMGVVTWIADQIGVEIPAVNLTLDPPVDASKVMPPILSMVKPPHPGMIRGALIDLPPIRRITTETNSTLPHEVRHRVCYECANGAELIYELTLTSHEPAVIIREEFRGIAQGGLRLNLNPGIEPTHGQERGRLHPPGEGEVASGYTIDFSKAWTGRLQPFYAWWKDYGLWWAAYKPGGTYVAILPLEPPKWTNPAPNSIQVHTGPDNTIEVFCPFRDGTRKWALVVADADEALAKSAGGTTLMMRLAIRLGQNPLDKVKDLTLTWPGMETITNPRLLCTPGDVAKIREKARTHPPFRRVRENHPEAPGDPAGLYLATGDEKYAREAIDDLIKKLRWWVEAALDGSGYGEALCDIGFTRPLRAYALVYDLVASSESMTAEERDYCLRAFAFLNYCLYDENRWPARYQGFHRGNVNFNSDDYSCRAVLTCLLAGHPKQKEWMAYVDRELAFEFDSSVYPGGAWCEAPNYQGYTMHYLMVAMRAMQLNGFTDWTHDPRFKAAMDYFFRIQTPFDVRAGYHMLPTVGDTTSYYHSQSLQNVFAWAATLTRDDPDFAGRMMHAWERGGSIVFGAHGVGAGQGWTQPLTLVEPDVPAVAPGKPLESERLPGYGALFRNHYGTGRESYFLFKMGQADQHYDSDEGSFHWYALGAPLSLDFGSMYNPSIEQPWLHSTLGFDHRRAWTRGEVTAFAALPGVDHCRGEMVVNDLQYVAELPGDPLPAGESGEIERHQRFIDWSRDAVFVKGSDYVVLCDTLDDAEDRCSTTWSLQVLASDVFLEGRLARFTGRHGVDLDVFIAEPADAKPTTSTWGHSGNAYDEWIYHQPIAAMGETQIALHTDASPDGDHLAAMVPYTHGEAPPRIERVTEHVLRVRAGPSDDVIFLAPGRTLMKTGEITFAGRVGLVQRGAGRVSIHILDGVSMRVPEMIAQFPGPVSLQIEGQTLTGAATGPTRTCFLHWTDPPPIPARLSIDGEPAYAYSTFDGYLSFTVPEGDHTFEVTYEKP